MLARLQPFLQAGFGVLAHALRGDLLQAVGEPFQHHVAAGVFAAVDDDGADQRFQGVGEDRITAVAPVSSR